MLKLSLKQIFSFPVPAIHCSNSNGSDRKERGEKAGVKPWHTLSPAAAEKQNCGSSAPSHGPMLGAGLDVCFIRCSFHSGFDMTYKILLLLWSRSSSIGNLLWIAK